MGKAYVMAGYFLLGVSCTGLFSFTAYAFPVFANYAFWLVVTVSLLLIVAAAGDDFFSDVMGLTYRQYIGGLIVIVALLFIGSLIQWVR
jgi:hypothetical protein